MFNLRFLVLLISLLCSTFGHADVVENQNKAFRNFWHPTFRGERLDYCSLDGKECGKQVANRFCRMLGYEHSSQATIAYNIGLTHFIDSRARCKGWRCNGFMTIGCVTNLSHKPPKSYHYREKRFVDPRYNHYRVDWCYEQGRHCGSHAANSFCSRMGYMKAKHYVKETQVSATQAIGSQQLCFGNQCNSFREIVCYR